MDIPRLEWRAPEYTDRPKHISWYWISIVVAVLILIATIWQRNFLFAIFVVLAEILILTWGERPPQMVDFLLTEKGLTIGGEKFYPWGEFKSFSIEKEEVEHLDWLEIVFFFDSHVKPTLKVRGPQAEIENIHQALAKKLPEVKWEPSLLDALEHFLHF